MAAPETRQFRPHPKLLLDVIRRQAGTLAKALLEAAMNSVDAKATSCEILVTPRSVRVEDDGHGFRNRQEIERWFEVFGQPHEESEGKTYAQFRLGRGQLFSFGRNRWRSGTFEMDVDVANNGIQYDLRDHLEPTEGCEILIELYEPLNNGAQLDLEKTLAQWAKYCPIPVLYNGRNLSHDPAQADWDVVTDDYYLKIRASGSLDVYNLGMYVLQVPGYRLGCGGTLVSRKPLDVNFARNDVSDRCPIWKKVRAALNERVKASADKPEKVSEEQRIRLLTQWDAGELDFSTMRQNVVETVTGRYVSLRLLSRSRRVVVAPLGSRLGELAHQQKLAFVVTEAWAGHLGCDDAASLVNRLKRREPQAFTGLIAVKLEDISELQGRESYQLLLTEKLPKRLQIWYRAIRSTMHLLGLPERNDGNRDLRIGVGPADGWTNSDTYIAISRDWLAKRPFSLEGVIQVGHLLLHEMVHHHPTCEDHDHDHDFYEEFHDRAASIGRFADACMSRLHTLLRTELKQTTKRLSQTMDVRDSLREVQTVLDEAPKPKRGKT
jgi:hypothetical protein